MVKKPVVKFLKHFVVARFLSSDIVLEVLLQPHRHFTSELAK